jgi:acetylornithine deacetylase/succinyl-diaminopimelate desuccinylase-like protein
MALTFLDRRRRQAARFALYGSLVLVASLTFLLVAVANRPFVGSKIEREWRERDYPNLPEVRLLQQYVRIDTSETTGDEIAGARFLAAQLEAAGIPARIEVVGDRKANLYALLEGEDPRPLVLHNHIDVSPVKRSEWSMPPFEGRIDVPWIYGRGVFDMKSVAIAQLLAMIDLKKSGVPLKRSVLFLATSSEERGSRLGVRRLIALRPEFVRSFWAVLTEGGVLEARARDDIKYWGTEVGQRRYADLIVCSEDRERLEELSRTVKEWSTRAANADLRVTREVKSFLAVYAPSRDWSELREMLAHPEETIADQAKFRQLPAYAQSMFRNEAVPFPVEEARGGGYQLTIKFQLLPGVELAEVREKLVPAWMTHGLSAALDEPPTARHGSPTDHPVFTAIEETLRESYPGAPVGPFFLAWTATDARFFRAAGVPSYGFSPFLIMSTDTYQVDAANERFSLPGFVDGVEIYRQLLRRLVSDT